MNVYLGLVVLAWGVSSCKFSVETFPKSGSSVASLPLEGSSDSVPPGIPGNLQAPSSTSNSVSLVWNPSNDNIGVTGYEVSINNSPGFSSGGSTTFVVTGLSASTSYSFRVRAQDAAGNFSGYSNAVLKSTLSNASGSDTSAPTVPGNLSAPSSTSSSVTLTWSPSSDNVGVSGYEVSINNGSGISIGNTPLFTATGLTASTSYSFRVRARDGAGNISAYGAAITKSTLPATAVTFDPLDFAPGTQLFSYAPDALPGTDREGICTSNCVGYPSTPTAGVTVSTPDQLRSYPVPRYKTGHTLERNHNGMDNFYLAGGAVLPDAQVQANATPIIDELARNFNYGVSIHVIGNYPSATTGSHGVIRKAVDVALQNNFPFEFFTLWAGAQVNIRNQNLPASCYLQNSSGSFILSNGKKYFRPTFSGYSGCPDSHWAVDGNVMKGFLDSYIGPLQGRTPFRVTENGELLFPPGNSSISSTQLEQDPVAVAEYSRSGIPYLSNGSRDWQTFIGQWGYRINAAYRNALMSSPVAGSRFHLYSNTGDTPYFFSYLAMRELHPDFDGAGKLSTADYYPSRQFRWDGGWGAWHGLDWFENTRYQEITETGDEFQAPFVAQGWNYREEHNIRPGAYLGQLKMHLGYGAKYFHQEFFSLKAPFPDARNWNWGAAIASYAQAPLSQVQGVFYNSEVLMGDKTINGHPAMNFQTSHQDQKVIVRKQRGVERYLIFGTVQPDDNRAGSLVENDATISLNGVNLVFKVRKQGSIYLYDRSNPAAPLFYQVDGWHEPTHPAHWSRDFKIEAELFENSSPSGFFIETEGMLGTDFRNARSYLSFSSLSASPVYRFQPRQNSFGGGVSDRSYFLGIKARKNGGGTASVTATLRKGGAVLSVKTFQISGSAWATYRAEPPGGAASFQNLAPGADYDLSLNANSTDVDIDSIHLAISASNIQ